MQQNLVWSFGCSCSSRAVTYFCQILSEQTVQKALFVSVWSPPRNQTLTDIYSSKSWTGWTSLSKWMSLYFCQHDLCCDVKAWPRHLIVSLCMYLRLHGALKAKCLRVARLVFFLAELGPSGQPSSLAVYSVSPATYWSERFRLESQTEMMEALVWLNLRL